MRRVLVCSVLFGLIPISNATAQQSQPVRKPSLLLTSTSFEDGGIIPLKYTNASPVPAVSPELHWTNVPEGTVSFALILDDQDNSLQKTTNMSLHWLIFNIPGTSYQLPEGVPPVANLPDGTIQAKSGPTQIGYKGMGAPNVDPYHHYTYWLYALDAMLPLDASATRADVYKALDGHILSKAVLVSRYHKELVAPAPTAH